METQNEKITITTEMFDERHKKCMAILDEKMVEHKQAMKDMLYYLIISSLFIILNFVAGMLDQTIIQLVCFVCWLVTFALMLRADSKANIAAGDIRGSIRTLRIIIAGEDKN